MQKVIPLGQAGQVVLSEAGGNASVQLSASLEAGGGDIKGFAKATVAVSVEVEGQVLIDAGLAIAIAKFGSNALIGGALKELQALIDAELAKL